MNKLRNKIYAMVFLTFFAILTVATLVMTTLNKDAKTTQSQAAETVCPLLGNPELINGGKCRVATNESPTLVCALVDPSKTPGDQLVAGQDPESGPLPVNWNISGGVGIVQLFKEPSITLSNTTQYRVVAYNWKDPGNCVRETDISGSDVVSRFNAKADSNTRSGTNNTQNGTTNQGNSQSESLANSALRMVEAIIDLTNTGGTTSQPISPTPVENPFNPSPIPSQTPNGNTVNQSFVARKQLYDYVGIKVKVPPCVLDAISYIEYSTAYDYTAEQIAAYTKPGGRIPNCPWNSCSAAGHMQMTMGTDERGSTSCNRCCWTNSQGVTSCQKSCPNAWSGYGNAMTKYESISHTPHVCNMLDSSFAAAEKLKHDSGTAPGDINWSSQAYTSAGRSYYGNCTVRYARLGNRTYCEFVAYNCSL